MSAIYTNNTIVNIHEQILYSCTFFFFGIYLGGQLLNHIVLG